MKKSANKGFGPARERENKVLETLAGVVLGLHHPDVDANPDAARLLGYAASLVKGGDKRLTVFTKHCRSVVTLLPVADVEAVDAVQRSWGARHHLDASKLRRELPLHVKRKQRSTMPVPVFAN